MRSCMVFATLLVFFTVSVLPVPTSRKDYVLEELVSHILKQHDTRDASTHQQEEQQDLMDTSKQTESNMNGDKDTKVALKREILHALIKLLHDELQQEEDDSAYEVKQHVVGKHTVRTSTYHDAKETGEKDAVGKVERKTAEKATEDSAPLHRGTMRRPAPFTGKREVLNLQQRIHKDVAKQNEADDELNRGPPGLWGRDTDRKSNEIYSDHGPPGLWGRDMENIEQAVNEKRRFLVRLNDDESERKLINDESSRN